MACSTGSKKKTTSATTRTRKTKGTKKPKQ